MQIQNHSTQNMSSMLHIMSGSDKVLVYFKHETKPGRHSCFYTNENNALQDVCLEYLNKTGIPNHEPFYEDPVLFKPFDFSITIDALKRAQCPPQTVNDDERAVRITVVEPVEVSVNLVRTTLETSANFFRRVYPTRTLGSLLESIAFFEKLAPRDRNVSINGQQIDKDTLVRDLPRHNRFHAVVDVEPDPASFSLALMMGTRERLGGDSFIFWMSEDFLRMVCVMTETKGEGSENSDDM